MISFNTMNLPFPPSRSFLGLLVRPLITADTYMSRYPVQFDLYSS